MTRGRRYLIGTTAAVGLLFACNATPAGATIPVIDTAALAQWATSLFDDARAYALQLQQYLTEVKTYIGDQLSWVTQASQYATQLQQYANELQMFISFVHNPSLGAAMGLLSAAGLGNTLPVNPYAVVGLVNGFEVRPRGHHGSQRHSRLALRAGRQVVYDRACLHPDGRVVGVAASHSACERNRRCAGRGAGGVQ